ncbi:hypothetical protein FRC04_006407 [Tulasnella sp. 424]|nr:hypothetical protein FRC04_006407 [Tulasnella sp. 424]
MALVCVTQVYRTNTERTTAATRLMEKLTQHRRKLSSPNIAHWVGFGFISPWNYACLVRYQDPGSLRLNEYLEEHPSANRFDIVGRSYVRDAAIRRLRFLFEGQANCERARVPPFQQYCTRRLTYGTGTEDQAYVAFRNRRLTFSSRQNTFVVSVSGVVQVAGFGLVELLGVAPEDLFTIRVSSLEVLQGAPPTTASDVYAFANVALEVFTGSQPWVKLARDATVLGALHRGSHSKAESYPDFPNKAVLWDLFKLCWDPDPAKRPVMVVADSKRAQWSLPLNVSGRRNEIYDENGFAFEADTLEFGLGM